MAELSPADAQLDDQAWAAQYRQTPHAVELGRQLVAVGGSAAARCAGWFHQAFGLLREVDLAAGRSALHQAWRQAHADRGLRWLARCRDAQAIALRRAKRPDRALALLARNAALPTGLRSARERAVTHNLSAMSHIALGDLDQALRQYLQARDAARLGGDEAQLANVCGNLAGLQADLLNLEDAAPLADEALAAAEAAGLVRQTLWFTATHNRAFIALAAGDGARAHALAQRLQAEADAIPETKRSRYAVLWAEAALAAGRLDEAEHWLAHARALWLEPDELLLEWSLVRASLDNRLGRHAQARAVCDAARSLTLSGGEEALPFDRMRLLEQGSQACEALGDAQAALVYAREAFAQYERIAGRAARARRVSAEAELSLALERQARDEEARRRQAAEAEQQRLAALNLALAEANAAKSRLLAAASHDLRQPLHALGLQVSNLRDALPAEAAAQATVDQIARSVGALAGLFDALLDVSQIESGSLQPRLAPLALQPLLLRLVEECQAQAETQGLRMVLRLPRAAHGLHVRSDAALLETLLRNVLGNALKYTPAGGVMLALRRRADHPGSWRLQVMDTGVGIPPEWQARVFDDFVQLDNPARSRARGLGLGLAIVRRLAALLAHPLALRSQPGRGTTVSLDLPEAADGPADAAPHAEDGDLSGLRVAVVEDDPATLDALTERLERWGARVVAAASGELLDGQLDRPLDRQIDRHIARTTDRPADLVHGSMLEGLHSPSIAHAPDTLCVSPGLPTLARRPIDALVTDLRLPGPEDGLALAHRLRARWGEGLPVVVISAELPKPASRRGDVIWLGKPVAAGALLAALQGLVREAGAAGR